MLYILLKALHLIAAMTWVGGMLLAGVMIAAGGKTQSLPAELATAVRSWDHRITSPAMVLTWGLGLSLAYSGSHFAEGWLQAKFALVFALSATHGMISGRLRRLADSSHFSARISTHAPVLVIVGMALIVVLVITKPF